MIKSYIQTLNSIFGPVRNFPFSCLFHLPLSLRLKWNFGHRKIIISKETIGVHCLNSTKSWREWSKLKISWAQNLCLREILCNFRQITQVTLLHWKQLCFLMLGKCCKFKYINNAEIFSYHCTSKLKTGIFLFYIWILLDKSYRTNKSKINFT